MICNNCKRSYGCGCQKRVVNGIECCTACAPSLQAASKPNTAHSQAHQAPVVHNATLHK